MSRDETADPRQTIVFHDGLTDIRDAVIVSANESWTAIYEGATSLVIASPSGSITSSIPSYVGGFFLVPLLLPPGTAVLTVDPAVTLDPSKPLLHARQSIVFGWPCWPRIVPAVCLPHAILEPPALPVSGSVKWS